MIMSKRKRIEAVICLAIIWSAAILQGYSLMRQGKAERINEVFTVLDSVPVEGCIEITAPLNKLYLNQEEKRQVLVELAEDLGLGNDYELSSEESEAAKTLTLKKEGDIGSVHLSVTTMEIPYQAGTEDSSGGTAPKGALSRKQNQYLYVLYRSNKKMDTMLAYKEKIEKLLRERNLAISSNLNFKGEKEGDLSLAEKDKLAQRLFQYLEAREVESVRERELYTVYGYSNLLKDSVQYGDREINLNLAFSYDEERNVTLFSLAMPYLRTDY